MSKGPGPTAEQRASEFAHAIAAAIGKFSDEQWRIGPWFMEITLVARKLADQIIAGELDERLVDIIKHHLPWSGDPPDPRNVNNEVAGTWTPLPPKASP